MSGVDPPYTGRATKINRAMTKSKAELRERIEELEADLDEAQERIDELDSEAQDLGETLYDLKTHVENVRMDAFRYPDTVRDLLSQAETLLNGDHERPPRAELEQQVEALWKQRSQCSEDLAHAKERIEELGAEVKRLRDALREISKGKGPFHRDELQHAENVIERQKEIAKSALDGREDDDHVDPPPTDLEQRLHEVWRITQQTHHDHEHLLARVQMQVPKSLRQDALERAEDGQS